MPRLNTRITDEQKEQLNNIQNQLGYKTQADFLLASAKALYDLNYVENETTILNDYVIKAIDSAVQQSELRIGNRFAKLMNELIIQNAVLIKILSEENFLTDIEVKEIRKSAMELLSETQTVIKYKEI